MYHEDCPFKVVRTNGGDEVLARAANLLIGRAAFETAKRLYPRDLIETGGAHRSLIETSRRCFTAADYAVVTVKGNMSAY
jgi:hypothetical protein